MEYLLLPSRFPSVSAAKARAWLLPLALSLALAGCATLESQGERPGGLSLPDSAPRTTGLDTPSQAEHKKMVALFGGEYKAPHAENYLNAILAKLAPASEQPSLVYKATILNTPTVNAFALPSGNLYATRGLLALANDTSEVAAVMAHEIAHVTARHASLRAEQEKRAELISQAAAVIQSRSRSEELAVTSKLSIAGFSRQNELDADAIGVRVIARAGYDPYGAPRFLAALGRSTALRTSLISQKQDSKPDILSTHPSTPERIALATTAARQIAAPGIIELDRANYLSVIDKMTFGDDPSEGVLRGTKFLHPRLGFTFTAPDGFALENMTQAVLGMKSGGAEAMRLDSVRLPTTTTLESHLSSGWIDGLLESSVERTEINGIEAVLATARAGEWNFRLAVFRMGGEVYRLIYAAKALNDETDRRFRASIGTFRRISNEEATRVKPLRLEIVTATEGDTAESLSRRMVVPHHPLEHFLLLNGLEKASTLQPGEKYKIVTE